jgi:hypothetical protein
MIIDAKKDATSGGLLGKLKIGDTIYELKDILAREAVDVLNGTVDTDGSILKSIKDNAKNADFQFTGASETTTLGSAIQAVQDALVAQKAGAFKVVDALPALDAAEPNVIYLVAKTATEENGGKGAPEGTIGFIEWVYVEDAGKFEEIGDTDIDLSGYYTKEETNANIAALSTEVATNMATLDTALTAKIDAEVAARIALDTSINTAIGDWSENSDFADKSLREAIESVYSAIEGQSTGTFVSAVALDTAWDAGSVSTFAVDTADTEMAVFTEGTATTIGGLSVTTALAVIPSAE